VIPQRFIPRVVVAIVVSMIQKAGTLLASVTTALSRCCGDASISLRTTEGDRVLQLFWEAFFRHRVLLLFWRALSGVIVVVVVVVNVGLVVVRDHEASATTGCCRRCSWSHRSSMGGRGRDEEDCFVRSNRVVVLNCVDSGSCCLIRCHDKVQGGEFCYTNYIHET